MKEVISFNSSIVLFFDSSSLLYPAKTAKLLPEGPAILSSNAIDQAPKDTGQANTKFQDYELCRRIQ